VVLKHIIVNRCQLLVSSTGLISTPTPEVLPLQTEYVKVVFNQPKYERMCKTDDILLVYILSTARNLERRHYIRKTYANRSHHLLLAQTCFVFILGLPSKDAHKIDEERLKYNDIVQIQQNETYQNVVFKEVGALQWSFENYPQIPYLFKTDDDLISDTILLTSIVHFLMDPNKKDDSYLHRHLPKVVQFLANVKNDTFFRGLDMGGQPTLRHHGKYSVSEAVWNYETLPVYCSGFGFMFSSFVRNRLYRASLHYPLEQVAWVGDVFVSGFLAGAGAVRCAPWPLDYQQVLDKCPEHFKKEKMLVCSTPMHSNRDEFCEYGRIWEVIMKRHSSTASNATTFKADKNCDETMRL